MKSLENFMDMIIWRITYKKENKNKSSELSDALVPLEEDAMKAVAAGD